MRDGVLLFGGVEPHLGADSVARRGIELRALGTGDDNEIAVGLKAGRHRPFDLGWIVNVHILVHDDHVLSQAKFWRTEYEKNPNEYETALKFSRAA